MADETATLSVEASAPTNTTEATESTERTKANDKMADATEQKGDVETSKEHVNSDGPAANGEQASDAEGTPADPAGDAATGSINSKDKKRKSTGGVPEHKAKKLNKKKSMPTLRLDCKPGEFYWARLKGYPPWPAVICDEEMLPESLLASRPVSTSRPDGSIRDDFKPGGKNAKERTFPIMFLHTNEFQWLVNTALTPLDPEECKTSPSSKMTKALQSAYQIAAEDHDISYFKGLLKVWVEEEEQARQAEELAAAEKERLEAERAAQAEEDAKEAETKPKKKAPRKSKAGDDDAEMEDADAPKSSKKRKKDVDSDGEVKPKKTPKVMKLNAPKTPNGEASSKKSTSKPKKKVVTAPKVEDEDELKPQMTEEERLAQREKAVLYLRHRLQKGFLSRDQAPQESEMSGMADFFLQLEQYGNLEPSIIRLTKIHKVLKAMVKLATIPKDDKYQFKKRSSALLEIWNKRMEAEANARPATAVEQQVASTTNGEREPTEPKDAEMKDESTVEKAEDDADKETEEETEEKADDNANGIDDKVEDKPEVDAKDEPVDPSAKLGNDDKDEEDETQGDVSMQTAPEDAAA